MSTFKSFGTFVLTLALLLSSTTVLAIPVAPAGYQIEVVAEYASGNLGAVTDMVIKSDGVVYVAHRGHSSQSYNNGSIARVDSTGVETRWVDNLRNARTLIWTDDLAFGENFYVVESNIREINRIDSNGNLSSFTNEIYQGPTSIDIDRNGSFGGDIIAASRGTDSFQRIRPDGSVSLFSNWPGLTSDGVLEIAISPTSRYNGNLFAAFNDAEDDARDGLYQIDTNGSATPFASSIDYALGIEFDTSGLMFDNDLFVIGTKPGVEGMYLWRIDELGNAEDFMRVGWGVINNIAFGSDGAMYLSRYTDDTTEILRVTAVPEPASLLLLSLGGFLIRRKRKV